jgi:hypothetical protein
MLVKLLSSRFFVTEVFYDKKNLVKFELFLSSKLIGTFSVRSVTLETGRFYQLKMQYETSLNNKNIQQT